MRSDEQLERDEQLAHEARGWWVRFVQEAFPPWPLETDEDLQRATRHARRVIRRQLMEEDGCGTTA